VRGLYAIVDASACARRAVSPIAFAEAVLSARPAAMQLRAKQLGARETLGLLRDIAPRCRDAGVPLIANDRPDLALLAGCDGVHLGQADLPAREVRALAERYGASLSIGVSTHGVADLDRALSEPIEMIAVGPVFGTASKEQPEPTVGLDAALALARTAAVKRPGVARIAIGGIAEADIPRLRAAFDLVAVIGALFPLDEGGPLIDGVRARAQALALAARGSDR